MIKKTIYNALRHDPGAAVDPIAPGISFTPYQKWWVELHPPSIVGEPELSDSYEFGDAVFCTLDDTDFTGFSIDLDSCDHDQTLGFYVEMETRQDMDLQEVRTKISKQLHQVVVDLFESWKESDELMDPADTRISIGPNGQCAYLH